MSYDLFVWDGPRPRDFDHWNELMDRFGSMLEEDPPAPPRPVIAAFVRRIEQRWGTLEAAPDDEIDDCPWSTSHMIENASGPIVMVSMGWSFAEDVSPRVAEIAHSFGLVCTDGDGFMFGPGSGTPPSIEKGLRTLDAIEAANQSKPWWSRVLGRG